MKTVFRHPLSPSANNLKLCSPRNFSPPKEFLRTPIVLVKSWLGNITMPGTEEDGFGRRIREGSSTPPNLEHGKDLKPKKTK